MTERDEQRSALIFGVAGQDGSFLAELLVGKGYRVVGAEKMAGPFPNLEAIASKIEVKPCDLRDAASVARIVAEAQPDEVYNLAGTTNVADTWDDPVRAAEETAMGPLHVLEAIRQKRPGARFFQATSSEMFGRPASSPQNEATPLRPESPYAAAKVYAHHMIAAYRARHGAFACSGILFNHESERRPPLFVTRKIARGAVQVKLGQIAKLELGSLDSRRDWGYAGDFVRGMWAMLQAATPDDFVLGTGAQHTVREFCEAAFARVGLDWRAHVVEDPALVRAADKSNIVADASKAERVLGWRATTTFAELVALMVDAERARLAEPAARG